MSTSSTLHTTHSTTPEHHYMYIPPQMSCEGWLYKQLTFKCIAGHEVYIFDSPVGSVPVYN